MRDPGRGLGLIGTIISRGFWWPEEEYVGPEAEQPNANFRRRPRVERIDYIKIEDEEIMVFL